MASWKTLGLSFSALLALVVGQASATVVTFDDLTGSGTVADGYGGINWGGKWDFYDAGQYPYTPASDFTRIYGNGYGQVNPFTFSTPVVFDGGYFSGQTFESVSFSLYLGGSLKASTSTYAMTDTPTFLSSGYSGLVDEVRVNVAVGGYWILDDVKYHAVPEPSCLALMGLGVCFAGVGMIRRRRSKQSR